MIKEQYTKMSTTELMHTYSDYHKDVHGYRPISIMETRELVINALLELDNCMEQRSMEDLMNDGWIINGESK